MKKRVLAGFLAACMVMSLAACGSSDSASEETNEATESTSDEGGESDGSVKTVTEGKLTVATSPDFAPYEFYALDENDNPTLAGFDIALAQYIADKLELELEIIPMDFKGTITELAAKKADIGMSGYSPDPDREDAMDFSDIYYTGGQSFVTVQANKDLFPDLASTNKAEYQIGAQLGSIQADLAKENSPDADIVELSKVTDIIAELLSGKLDGAYIETLPAQAYAKNYPDLAVVLDVPYEAKGSVIGVCKGNGPLLAAINLCIQEAIADGSLEQFVTEASELASGNIHEGLLDEDQTPAE